MITKKQKIMSIINMCNAIEREDLKKKKDSNFWVLRIKEICEGF